LGISILWTSVLIIQMMWVIWAWILVFLQSIVVICVILVTMVFSSGWFAYYRGVFCSIHYGCRATCWCCLGWRHLSRSSLLLISTYFIYIYGRLGTLLNRLAIFWHFRGIRNTAYAVVLIYFGHVTSKSWLISCVIVIVCVQILINSILRVCAQSYWRFWHLLL